jgi:uncharacterized membrane protein YccC
MVIFKKSTDGGQAPPQHPPIFKVTAVPPRIEHWLFSIKAFLAGMLALAVAFWLDLPRPYWALATVYIASQPLTGATRSKAFFRVMGTLAGAAMAVILIPNLVNAPPVLVLAVALWCSLCLYFSILDRSPRGYAFMLAGYTTAIIGFPAVDSPAQIFDLALSRTEEILVGIFCASLTSSLLFPRSVGPVVAESVVLWLEDARTAAQDAARRVDPGARQAHWLRLAADTAKIENVAAHLPFETTAERDILPLVQRLVPRVLMTLPEISAIGDLMAEVEALGGPSPKMASLIERTERALAGKEAAAYASTLDAAEAFIAEFGPIASWRVLAELSLAMRLRDLMALISDQDALAHALAGEVAAESPRLSFRMEASADRVRYEEHGRALGAAATLFIALVLCCSYWILTSWPDGAAAAMMAAVAASLFATQDDPAPPMAKFAFWSAVAVAVSGVYVFAVLPNVHTFETLALALAPPLLLFGLLIAEPRTFITGVALGIVMPTTMALQRAYDVDAEAFLNTGFAIVAGMTLATVTTAVLRRAGAKRRAEQFLHANERSLAVVADVGNRRDDAHVMGLMFDRLSLLAPIVEGTDEELPEAMRQLRAGLNMVEARRARARLNDRRRRRLDAALLRLQRNYRRHVSPGVKSLEALNRAIAALRPDDDADRPALLALSSLRRCLFPEAAPALLNSLERNIVSGN